MYCVVCYACSASQQVTRFIQPDASPDELQAAANAFKRIVTAYQVTIYHCTCVMLRIASLVLSPFVLNPKPLFFPLVNRYCVTAVAAEPTTSCPRPLLLFNRKSAVGIHTNAVALRFDLEALALQRQQSAATSWLHIVRDNLK